MASPLPDAYFLSFEALNLALLLLCLRDAYRRGRLVGAWVLLAGVLFGLMLELATIQQLQAYRYGRFVLMLGEVPLAIGIGWGVIVYSARRFTDALSAPGWSRALMDALLALNIDLSMDAIAIRLGFWDWGRGLDFQYFGVPYANFWAWMWVVFFFSAGLRVLERMPGVWGRWLAPPGAVAIGVAGVLGTNALIAYHVDGSLHLTVVGALLLLALAVVLLLAQRGRIRRNDDSGAPARWVPFGYHLYFLGAGLISGALFNPPALLLVALVMSALAGWLHKPAR